MTWRMLVLIALKALKEMVPFLLAFHLSLNSPFSWILGSPKCQIYWRYITNTQVVITEIDPTSFQQNYCISESINQVSGCTYSHFDLLWVKKAEGGSICSFNLASGCGFVQYAHSNCDMNHLPGKARHLNGNNSFPVSTLICWVNIILFLCFNPQTDISFLFLVVSLCVDLCLIDGH